MKESPLILALDMESIDEMWKILDIVGDKVRQIKIGHRLFALGGKELLRKLNERWKVFLDFKLHDIPSVIALAVRTLADEGVWALTLHTAGGRKMLEEAVKERERSGGGMLLLGVTILTSLSKEDWEELAPGASFERALLARAKMCYECGLNGLVCSAKDLPLFKEGFGKELLKVVPGIRLNGGLDDQARTATPKEAILNGADFIVVGRSITKAEDPREAVERIEREIEEARALRGGPKLLFPI